MLVRLIYIFDRVLIIITAANFPKNGQKNIILFIDSYRELGSNLFVGKVKIGQKLEIHTRNFGLIIFVDVEFLTGL